MDQQQPAESQNNQQQMEQIKKIKKTDSKGKLFLIILLVLLLVAGAAFAGWWYRDAQAKDQLKAKDAEIATLTSEKKSLESQLAEAKTAAESTEEEETLPTEEQLENIQAAISSNNYAALESFVDDKVTVILAASECCGERTFAQAAEDLKYLNDATTPWDFALDEATLEGYASGDYASYFPEGAMVGKSANDYVVSVTFTDEGKFDTIFVTNNASVL